MAILKIPSAGTPVSGLDLYKGLLGRGGIDRLEADLGALFGVPWCGLTGSGTSALYAILRVLRERSDRQDVLLPAYTAPSLVLPIRKAGLRPVLCDISPQTLNAGPDEILDRVTGGTLAALPVHMFGLPVDMPALAGRLRGSGTFIVEDACSAMGTQICGRHAGTFGDVGFYSFNRGKNLATLAGGAVVTGREDLVPALASALAAYPGPGPARRVRNAAYAAALAAAVRPLGYTLLYPLVARFKYTDPHTDFETWRYTGFQARVGRSLLARLDRIFEKRLQNGRLLARLLDGVDGVRLPRYPDGCLPVYNQFPVLLPDEPTRAAVHRAVLKTGLEATLLYPKPIHRIYPDIWDGAGPDPFPNATAVSKRLLLIPVHPLVPGPALERAAGALKGALK